jgi:RNA polymerase sigma-70 factor (sigma-E family)
LGMRSDLSWPASCQSPEVTPPGSRGLSAEDAVAAVTAVYNAQALTLVRMAHVMLGDRGRAEDVVQEAFYGLYRRWAHLSDPDKALLYVRSAVLNGCRTALRPARRREIAAGMSAGLLPGSAADGSGEAAALASERRQAVLSALRALPPRQREVLVLRFYLGMTEAQIAAQMGIGQSTVRSTAHRAFAALSPVLEEAR